jgi:putative PIN family toxin of toxin-antitoxin system
VVVDSNVLVSIALKSKALAPIREAWVEGRFTLLGSEPLLRELEEVLRRDKFDRLITPLEVDVFLSSLRETVTWLDLKEPYPGFSDPKDSFLLAMARNSGAQILVTGDKALLDLGRFEETEILSPRAFVERIQQLGRARK